MKKVNIKIKDGKISADFSGFIGKACEQLEHRLRPDGLEVEEKELKPEYHMETGHTQTDTQKETW